MTINGFQCNMMSARDWVLSQILSKSIISSRPLSASESFLAEDPPNDEPGNPELDSEMQSGKHEKLADIYRISPILTECPAEVFLFASWLRVEAKTCGGLTDLTQAFKFPELTNLQFFLEVFVKCLVSGNKKERERSSIQAKWTRQGQK